MAKKTTYDEYIKTKLKNEFLDEAAERHRKKTKFKDPYEQAGYDFAMNGAKNYRDMETTNKYMRYTTGVRMFPGIDDPEEEEDDI